MLRYFIFISCFFWMLKSSYSQENGVPFQAAAFPYIHPEDTVLLYQRGGRIYYNHIIQPKQTLYSIAKYYGIGLEELYRHNPKLRGSTIEIGDMLRVPIPRGALVAELSKIDSSRYARCYYKVLPGETLYGIARRTFNSSVAYLKQENTGVMEKALHPGQILEVGRLDIHGISPFKRMEDKTVSAAFSRERNELDSGFIVREKVLTHDKNLAFWNKNSKQSGLYVLHKYIARGTVIELYNPNMNISVKAKVVGHILPGTYPEDIDLVVSSQVANDLGVIDPRFYVKVSYYK